jgi:hypothetical protein
MAQGTKYKCSNDNCGFTMTVRDSIDVVGSEALLCKICGSPMKSAIAGM